MRHFALQATNTNGDGSADLGDHQLAERRNTRAQAGKDRLHALGGYHAGGSSRGYWLRGAAGGITYNNRLQRVGIQLGTAATAQRQHAPGAQLLLLARSESDHKRDSTQAAFNFLFFFAWAVEGARGSNRQDFSYARLGKTCLTLSNRR